MKSLTFITVVFIISLSLFTNLSAQQIPNSSFEEWSGGVPTGWTRMGELGELTQSVGYPGIGVRMEAVPLDTSHYWVGLIEEFSCTTKYDRFRFYYKSYCIDDQIPPQLGLFFYDQNGLQCGQIVYQYFTQSINTNEWTLMDLPTVNWYGNPPVYASISFGAGGNQTYGYGSWLEIDELQLYNLVEITEPQEGAKWIAGETDTIKWNNEGLDDVELSLLYSTDDGANWENIVDAISSDSGKYAWDIPDDLLAYEARIRIGQDVPIPGDGWWFKVHDEKGLKIKPYIITRVDEMNKYVAYDIEKDRWGFGNSPEEMWPVWWWLRFNYKVKIDPFTDKPYPQNICDNLFANAKFSDRPDWLSFVNAFGINSCYRYQSLGIYRMPALIYWKAIKGNWGGSCFGIAISNALAFEKRDNFVSHYNYFPAFGDPVEVRSDANVIPVTMELFTHQFGNPHRDLRNNILIHKKPTETINDLKEMLTEDNVEIRTLSLVSNSLNPLNQGGHAINAYKLEQDTLNPELYYVYVWDNSYPNVLDARILVDTSGNGGDGIWDPEYGWNGWEGDKWFYLRDPANQYLTNAILPKARTSQSPFILDENELEVYNTKNAYIVIKDNLGNQTGFTSSGVLNQVPNSIPLVAEDGSIGPPYGYYLPKDDYSVVMNNFSADTIDAFFFTGNKSFSYERYGATSTQTDRLFFDGGVSVTNTDTEVKSVKLMNIINDTTSADEKLFLFKSLNLAQNDSVKVINRDNNNLDLISYGTEKNYQIELEYASDVVSSRFVNDNVSLSANTTHKLVPNWGDFADLFLTIYVDEGNDGAIDDTLIVQNQSTGVGEDQGSLIPQEYKLEQNYPNPFNNSTVIKYSIRTNGLVSLKVFDILGKEIVTLVNEEKSPGTYEVKFNATNLPSGVYFYRIQAGSFVETKKMVLMK